ncbi:glycosyltransferase family 4 protein [uncultured Desulfovibrio sp.]|uniref:glycosyltransferase family 4 protein n=1 Tax=uncultured Desulfovibrio sp. TaxID=167968 RepID=UPI0025E86D19|nr:glycosyltransferase family 4 protein [uncultured Desulfovibrio sp.]
MDIAVITREFSPLTRNGGIGTAMRHLCDTLARAAGHRLTVYYTGRPHARLWRFSRALRRCGMEFRPVIAPLGLLLRDPVRRSRAACAALRGTRHDCYLFHEFMADGWFFLRERRRGHPPCGIVTHGSALWVDEGNGRVAGRGARAALYAMERECCERADFLVSPSRYLLGWMRDRGWHLPERTAVIPNFASGWGCPPPRCRGGRGAPGELVFFGRLEERKGLRVFCEALHAVPVSLLAGRQVTFLGREGGYAPAQVAAWLAPLARKGLRLMFRTAMDADEARAYLCGGDRLAVMPSLRENSPCVVHECLESGIPFLASSSGGGPELARPEDRDAFVAPQAAALAARLGSILADGLPAPARPRHSPAELLHLWQTLLEEWRPRTGL